MRSIYSLLRNKLGAASVEYALILAIIGAGIAAGIVLLGQDITGTQSNAGAVIQDFSY
jgi:Flp pilus assembly pilin Flp